MKTGIIVAMDSEFDALTGCGIPNVVKAGIGKVNAARTATELILTQRPDCIINSGVAGGIDACLQVGDFVVGTEVAYHDVWCGEGNLRGQVQGLPQRFAADPGLIRKVESLQCAHTIHKASSAPETSLYLPSKRTSESKPSIRTPLPAIWSLPQSRRYAISTGCRSCASGPSVT